MKVLFDTNVLMSSPELIQEYIEKSYKVFIPIVVVEELDSLKKLEGEKSFKARQAIKYIESNLSEIEISILKLESELKNDDAILRYAEKLDCLLLTSDLNMLIKAKALKVKAEKYTPYSDDKNYKGYRHLYIGSSNHYENGILSLIHSNSYNGELDLFPNEYLIVKNQDDPVYDKNTGDLIGYKTVDIRRWNGKELVNLKLPPERVIKPLNDLQKCTLDLLYCRDIPIKIIAGCYGSGKTMAAVRVGVHLVEEKEEYSKLVFLRNNDLDAGKDPGALPGTLDDKTNILFRTMTQHLPGGEYHAEKLERDEMLEKHITYFIKGLSINGFVIMDEAEDCTIKDIKKIGSRIEKDSCIVFCGDWKQSEGRYRNNNGLVHLLNQTKDNPLVGACVMDLDVRSDASKVFADL